MIINVMFKQLKYNFAPKSLNFSHSNNIKL